jgi:hypothetical protein
VKYEAQNRCDYEAVRSIVRGERDDLDITAEGSHAGIEALHFAVVARLLATKAARALTKRPP